MRKFVLAILILSSCHLFNQLSFDDDLTSKINLQYSRKNEPVDLIKITDFEWDSYIIIGCYQIPSLPHESFRVAQSKNPIMKI